MTLAAIEPRILITGTGTLGPFSLSIGGVPLRFTSNSHIRVTRFTAAGVGTTLVEGTDYTLTGGPNAGSLLLTSPQTVLLNTEKLLIERAQPFAQDLALGNAQAFPSASVEARLDKLTEFVQDLSARANRAVLAHPLDLTGQYDMPRQADRVSKLAGWDANGDFTPIGALSSGTVVASTMLPVVSAATIAAARAALGINVSDNRIINGRMEIDQRNAGSAVTINASSQIYTLDRWLAFGQAADGVFTVQRQSGGPAGFPNFLRATVTTADASIGASQIYVLCQKVEGVMISDLAWGSASAATVALRFLVRSSLTGTFSGSIMNSGANRIYPFTFAVNAANTWETKSVVIPGDTAGTWLTDTGVGLQMWIDLGCGSSNRGTAAAWGASVVYGATGATSLISTLNATFDLTGVELVRSSADLGPSWRPFAQELALAQRYYEKSYQLAFLPGSATLVGTSVGPSNFSASASHVRQTVMFKVQKRAAPTISYWDAAGNLARASTLSIGGLVQVDNNNIIAAEYVADHSFQWGATPIASVMPLVHWTAAAEL